MGNIMSKKTYDIGQYFPFWGSLNEAEKNLITNNSQVIKYEKGFQMPQCEQGCNGIMIVLSGQMRTYISSEEGREVTLFRVFKDEVCVLSAAGLMDAIVFDVMIDAVEASEILMIPVAVLEPMIKRHPEMEAYIYRTATERFSEVVWIMQQILFLSVDKRVAQFIWDEITRTGVVDVTLTHDEIARYIGSAREVVTKVLKYFQSEGVVVLSRGKISIVDKNKLKKYC